PSNHAVLAFLRTDPETEGPEAVPTLVVANLSRFAQPVELDLSEYIVRLPVEVIGQQPFPKITDAPYVLTLGPHAFYWFDLVPVPVEEHFDPSEAAPAVTVRGGDWRRLLEGDALRQLEREILPAYLERPPWSGGDRSKPLP